MTLRLATGAEAMGTAFFESLHPILLQ